MTLRRSAGLAPADLLTPPAEAELGFQGWLVDLAERLGYLVYRHPDSRKTHRGRRARNTASGFPDLVIVHPRRPFLAFVEAKRDGRYPTPEQRAWHAALRLAGATVHVWRPRDRPAIEQTLLAAARPPAGSAAGDSG
jgi:hypothetical protein